MPADTKHDDAPHAHGEWLNKGVVARHTIAEDLMEMAAGGRDPQAMLWQSSDANQRTGRDADY